MKSLECYCILHIEKIDFEEDINSPIFVRVKRVQHSGVFERVKCNLETSYNMLDANHTAQFDCEFCIPVTMFQKDNKLKKKKIDIEIIAVKKKNETISKVRMDISNLADPRSTERQHSSFDTPYGKADLTFRLVVLPRAEFSEKPVAYFGFITMRSIKPIVEEVAQTATQFTDFDETQTTSTDEKITLTFDNLFVNDDNNMENVPSLESFIKHPHKKAVQVTTIGPRKPSAKLKDLIAKNKKKKVEESGEKEESVPNERDSVVIPGEGFKKRFLFNSVTNKLTEATSYQSKMLSDINIEQCKACFVQIVYDKITVVENRNEDYSADLIKPFIDFRIATNPFLNPDKIEYIVSPFYKAVDSALSMQNDTAEVFGLFATILNFGIELSSYFSEYTSAHKFVLEKLSAFIMQVMNFFTQSLMSSLVSAVMGDGFDAIDKETLSMVTQQIRIFTQLAHSRSIPDIIIQAIVVDTCNQFDTLLFNIIIDTADVFTEEKIDSLLHHIKVIQEAFECFSSNFNNAFTHLLNFITTSKALMSRIDKKRITPSPLLRSIAERISPSIVLPPDMKIEDLGPSVSSRVELKVSKENPKFIFSFDKLFTESSTGNYDY